MPKRKLITKDEVALERKEISPLRRKMIEHIVTTGDGPTKTAKALNCNRSSVQLALRDPVVQQELQDQVGHRLARSSAIASSTLISLARGANSEYVRLQASDSILDRTGFKPPEKSLHLVQGEVKISIDLGD